MRKKEENPHRFVTKIPIYRVLAPSRTLRENIAYSNVSGKRSEGFTKARSSALDFVLSFDGKQTTHRNGERNGGIRSMISLHVDVALLQRRRTNPPPPPRVRYFYAGAPLRST